MLSSISSVSSFGSAGDASQLTRHAPSTTCAASTTVAESFLGSDRSTEPPPPPPDDLCLRLDRASTRRLDQQCARMRVRQPQASELGEIASRAGRLSAQRLANQDYMPASVRRIEGLERLAARPPSEEPAPHRPGREPMLAAIAARLSRTDGLSRTEGPDLLRAPAGSPHHPRDHMRRILLRSIDRLHRLGSSSSSSSAVA